VADDAAFLAGEATGIYHEAPEQRHFNSMRVLVSDW
jgi:hypothetical protein